MFNSSRLQILFFSYICIKCTLYTRLYISEIFIENYKVNWAQLKSNISESMYVVWKLLRKIESSFFSSHFVSLSLSPFHPIHTQFLCVVYRELFVYKTFLRVALSISSHVHEQRSKRFFSPYNLVFGSISIRFLLFTVQNRKPNSESSHIVRISRGKPLEKVRNSSVSRAEK